MPVAALALSQAEFTLKKDDHGALLIDESGKTIARFADTEDAERLLPLLNGVPTLVAELAKVRQQRQSSARQWRDSFESMHQRAMAVERDNKELVMLFDELLVQDTAQFDEIEQQNWRDQLQLNSHKQSLLGGDYVVLSHGSSKDFAACLSRACQLGFRIGDRVAEVGFSGITRGDYTGLQIHEDWVVFHTGADDQESIRPLSYVEWLGTDGVPKSD